MRKNGHFDFDVEKLIQNRHGHIDYIIFVLFAAEEKEKEKDEEKVKE